MTLLLPQASADQYPIGSIIEAEAPPTDKWVRCVGQVELQSAYPDLFAKMSNPHCTKYWGWTRKNPFPTGVSLYGRGVWGGGKYVIMGYNSSIVSSDLVTWSKGSPGNYNFRRVAWNGSVFCAVNDGANNIVVTSPDGVNWTNRTGYSANGRMDICWDGTYFLTSGVDANVWRSTDGVAWALAATITGGYSYGCQYNYQICSDGAGMVVMGNDYTMRYSTDHGSTWTMIPQLPSFGGLEQITYENGKWFAVCEYRPIGRSDDGIHWDFQEYVLHDHDIINPPDPHGWQNGSFWLVRWVNDRYWILSDSYRNYWTQDWKTLHVVPCLDEYNGWCYDVIWDANRSKVVMIGTDLEYFTYELDDLYNTNTHFQFPIFPGSHSMEFGKNYYIKVRS